MTSTSKPKSGDRRIFQNKEQVYHYSKWKDICEVRDCDRAVSKLNRCFKCLKVKKEGGPYPNTVENAYKNRLQENNNMTFEFQNTSQSLTYSNVSCSGDNLIIKSTITTDDFDTNDEINSLRS